MRYVVGAGVMVTALLSAAGLYILMKQRMREAEGYDNLVRDGVIRLDEDECDNADCKCDVCDCQECKCGQAEPEAEPEQSEGLPSLEETEE